MFIFPPPGGILVETGHTGQRKPGAFSAGIVCFGEVFMGYRFVFGASGSGKSTAIHKRIIEEAAASMKDLRDRTRYLVIVPEQYSMRTQMELVTESPDLGIMNIDILSFGRLSYRIFEETGASRGTVLGEIGKSLLIRRAATACRKDLKILGRNIGRLGMISEVKSVLSEFMQYGVGEAEIDDLIAFAGSRGQKALRLRLEDLKTLYRGFQAEKKNVFYTAEESMDLLARVIPRSESLKDSVLVFDGFTGFTPIQYKVIEALMKQARECIFVLTIGPDGGPHPSQLGLGGPSFSDQDLFYLTRKTVMELTRRGASAGIPRLEDLYLPEREDSPRRYLNNPPLDHLEKSLSRHPRRAFEGDIEGRVRILEAASPEEEVRQTCIQMKKLIAEKGYSYRDFALICGDLETYGDLISRAAEVYGIPVYVDQTRRVIHNPLTEAIRSLLQIGIRGFDYETVFRYLRSGISSLTREETDLLENYCLEHGIRGRRKWRMPFDAETEPMRLRFLNEIAPMEMILLENEAEEDSPAEGEEGIPVPEENEEALPAEIRTGDQKRHVLTVGERTRQLYAFLTGVQAAEKMDRMAEEFGAAGDVVREKEYSQLYGSFIELLDQLYQLLSQEPISASDYLELLEAGISEIRLGTLPQRVDRVLCGDMERTRPGRIRVLFFLGVNDGSIPRSASRGGILSDLDRELLTEQDIALAPAPREQINIQRFYLYLNLTRPADMLILSYSRISRDGKSLRPSYLISEIRALFPALVPEDPSLDPPLDQLTGVGDGLTMLSEGLRLYAEGSLEEGNQEEDFLDLYRSFERIPEAAAKLEQLRISAFSHYDPVWLSRETARALYSDTVRGSISRMERSAQCLMFQFLKYGLGLSERKEYTYKANDTGTILHDSLKLFGRKLRKSGLDWETFTKEQGRDLMTQALTETAAAYHDQLLYSSERSRAELGRLWKILDRTVETLQYQLLQGSFTPWDYEKAFGMGEGSEPITFELEGGRSLEMTGIIDRVDLCRDGDRIYVKILDYKSGSRDLDREQMEKGYQLQLLVYMNAVLDQLRKDNQGQEIVPSAMLYYRLDNPMTDADPENADFEDGGFVVTEEDRKKLRKKLRPTGMVLGEEDSMRRLDKNLSGSSDVIPVQLKKDRSPDARSRVYSGEDFEAMTEAARKAVCRVAVDILDGATDASPARLDKTRTACDYCEYKNVCGFDIRIPGYDYRS
jgi:ATP-dependent helicase/nuclease subunit B